MRTETEKWISYIKARMGLLNEKVAGKHQLTLAERAKKMAEKAWPDWNIGPAAEKANALLVSYHLFIYFITELLFS